VRRVADDPRADGLDDQDVRQTGDDCLAAGAQRAGLGRDEPQRALHPLGLRRHDQGGRRLDDDDLRQECDQVAGRGMPEAHRAAHDARCCAAADVAQHGVAIARVVVRQGLDPRCGGVGFAADDAAFAVGHEGHVQGRQAAVDTYEQFTAAATVHAADFDEADVRTWGDTAVATYRFTLDYAMAGAHNHDTGWDVLVLRRAAGTWQVVWRTIIPGAVPPTTAS
jgi:hypothetical protein